jgi:hypothetical protein
MRTMLYVTDAARAPFVDGEGGRGHQGEHHGSGELRPGDALAGRTMIA